MPPDVVEALELIMKEEGINTMTKAINSSILQRKMMRESIREEEAAALKLNNENLDMRDTITRFVGLLEIMKTY